MDAQQFDNILKKRLSQSSADVPADAWERFEVYQAAKGVSVTESSGAAFDDLLRSRLSGLMAGVPTAGAAWDVFSDKLKESEQIDAQTFDRILHKRLQGTQVAYQPGHWQLMSNLLDLQFSRFASILKWKSFELLAFVAILFLSWPNNSTLYQTAPAEETVSTPPVVAENVVPPMTEMPALAEEVATTTPSADITLTEAKGANTPVPSAPSEDISSTVIEGALADQLPANTATRLHSFYTSQPLASSANAATTRRYTRYAFAASLPNLEQLFETTDDPDWELLGLSFSETQLLPSLAMETLSYADNLQWRLRSTGSRASNLRVSMYGAPDYNRIITPEQELQDTTIMSDRYALGYSGGLGLSWEVGRWALESGFVYTAKEYRPQPVLYQEGTFYEGYTSQGFKKFELNMVQVPVQLRYNVVQNNRWRMYTLLGASLQVALEANYDIGEQEDFGTGGNSLAFEQVQAPARRPSGIERKDLSAGFFEGGSFKDNSYVTANLGLGLERIMTTRWSVFAQPTYHHTFFSFDRNGLGPEHDRLHTMSIFTGVRVRLNED